MEIKVKWKGKLLDPLVFEDAGATVLQLKKKLEALTEVEAMNQKLLLKGKQLKVNGCSFLNAQVLGRRSFIKRWFQRGAANAYNLSD